MLARARAVLTLSLNYMQILIVVQSVNPFPSVNFPAKRLFSLVRLSTMRSNNSGGDVTQLFLACWSSARPQNRKAPPPLSCTEWTSASERATPNHPPRAYSRDIESRFAIQMSARGCWLSLARAVARSVAREGARSLSLLEQFWCIAAPEMPLFIYQMARLPPASSRDNKHALRRLRERANERLAISTVLLKHRIHICVMIHPDKWWCGVCLSPAAFASLVNFHWIKTWGSANSTTARASLYQLALQMEKADCEQLLRWRRFVFNSRLTVFNFTFC